MDWKPYAVSLAVGLLAGVSLVSWIRRHITASEATAHSLHGKTFVVFGPDMSENS